MIQDTCKKQSIPFEIYDKSMDAFKGPVEAVKKVDVGRPEAVVSWLKTNVIFCVIYRWIREVIKSSI